MSDLKCEAEELKGKLSVAEEANNAMKEKYELERDSSEKKVYS